MKPKKNYTPGPMDNCQTPPYALAPLLPYLPKDDSYWESAAGEGVLVRAMRDAGLWTTATDISYHPIANFLGGYSPGFRWSKQVTNPPYGLKFAWLKRSYELGKPFALLLPVETLGASKAQELFKQYGAEFLMLDARVDFKMPNKGWDSSAQFPVMWVCWNILPEQVVYSSIKAEKAAFKKSLFTAIGPVQNV